MNFKPKYLKYKSKYLSLKGQSGGSNHDDLLESQTKNFIASLKNTTPIYKLTPTEARDVLNKIQSDESYKSMVDMEDLNIQIENENISITIFRPKNNKNVLPAIMYFHGGGWILGNKQTHGRLVSEIAVGANVAIVFVNYTLAPEAKYPIQLRQCYLATKYIGANGKKHNLNVNKLIVAGDSVGGGLATVVTMLANEITEPKISYQILFYPVTDSLMNTISYQEYYDGPWLTKAAMEWFFNAYESDLERRRYVNISPLTASKKQLRNLPPTLIITDENDVLRDEGEIYAHKLMQAGVEVIAIRYLGTIHDFLMLDPLKNTPAVKSALKLTINQIKDILS